MTINVVPLKGTFMIASIIGFLISAVYIYRNYSASWGFAFMIVFIAMFIASLISMTYSPTEM